MQRRGIAGDGHAQFGQAEVVGIEGFARVDRTLGGFSDGQRRDLVALAEPEGQHVVAAESGIRDFADLRSRQLLDHLAHAFSFMLRRAPSAAAR